MATGRPPKSISLVKGHRTKKEIESRKKSEEQLKTGFQFKEWDTVKNDLIAHKEFTRLQKLFKARKMCDMAYENSINRYCQLHSEAGRYVTKILGKEYEIYGIKNMIDISTEARVSLIIKIEFGIREDEKALMAIRKMMLSIEKENALTVQSVLRSVPKQPEKEKENPMEKFIRENQSS